MPQTFNFFAPALHPNTILDISIPEPGPSSLEPIVKHLPIKYGDHKPVGNIKRMIKDHNGNVSWNCGQKFGFSLRPSCLWPTMHSG